MEMDNCIRTSMGLVKIEIVTIKFILNKDYKEAQKNVLFPFNYWRMLKNGVKKPFVIFGETIIRIADMKWTITIMRFLRLWYKDQHLRKIKKNLKLIILGYQPSYGSLAV